MMDNVGCRLLTGSQLSDGTKATVPGDLNASKIDYNILQHFRQAGGYRTMNGGFAAGKYLNADFNAALITPEVAAMSTANPP